MAFLKKIALPLGLVCCISAPTISGCSAASSDEESVPTYSPDSSTGDGDGDGDGDVGPTDNSPPLILGEDPGAGGAGGASATESCLSFMSWGTVAVEGIVPGGGGEAAIVSWLRDKSNADGAHYADKPDITQELLAGVDVIVLHDLSGWEISEEEVQIFRDWVLQGGGVFALSGYVTDTTQVIVTNRLLSFTGLKFLTASEGGETATNIGQCSYCLGVTAMQTGFQKKHPIAYGVQAVGAFQGRAVKGEGDVVAEELGQILAVSKSIESGRVFLFHDDWIASSDKWQMPVPAECMDNLSCADVSPSLSYQIPQLWYNALRFLSPSATCFDIADDSILR